MEYSYEPVEGINWREAHRYLPTMELANQVLEEFVETAGEQKEKLINLKQGCLDNPTSENFKEYRVKAHAMKASLRSIGADLFDDAYELEMAGNDENLSVIEQKTDAFTDAYVELAGRVKPILKNTHTDESFDEDSFSKKITNIREAMSAFDVSSLQSEFQSVKKMNIPANLKGLIAQLEVAVRDLAMDDVFSYCDSLEELIKG